MKGRTMFEYAIHTADAFNTTLHFYSSDDTARHNISYIGIVDEQGREYDFRGERDAWSFCIDCDLEPVNYDFVDGYADADVYHDGQHVGRTELPVSVEVRYCVNTEH